VIADPEKLQAYSGDMTENDPAEPALVVCPGSAGEVQAVVRLCAQQRVPITPVVANTNLGGLAIPARGGLVMDLRRMNRVLEVDRDGNGGGLSWVGTYGPTSRFAEGFSRGSQILAAHGFSPVVVCRPMLGGHFGVLRWISVFDRADPAEVARVKAANRELAEMSISLGFFPYKTPQWVWDAHGARLDPAFRDLVDAVRRLLDPAGIMNPGRLRLPPLSPP